MVLELIKDTKSKSDATQSRRRITLSVGDSNVDRYGKTIAYCSNWWSKKHNNTTWGQNILGITIKIGDIAIPLNTCLVSKQGRGNTKRPVLFVVMMQEVLDFFDAEGVNIRKYPITFYSWYGSKKLVNILSDLGFVPILVYGKNNYVMTIGIKKRNFRFTKSLYNCVKVNGDVVINLFVVSKPQIQHLVSVLCCSFMIWARYVHSWFW